MSIRSWNPIAVLLVAAPCAAQSASPAAPDTAGGPPPAVAPASVPEAPAISTPPDFPRGRISGYLFGDVYYNTSGDPAHVYTATGADLGQPNIDGVKPITQDLNGIQLRRVYVQLDNDLTIRFATRVRLEIDNRSLSADGKTIPYVKNAYVQAKSVIPRGDFYFGMISTPIWEGTEELWDRAIEKTIADFRNLASSSDLGIELKGFVDGGHHIGYAAMIGDGLGQKPETDRFKKLYLSLPLRLGELRLEPYADYQSVRVNLMPAVPTHTDSLAVNNDQATWKLFTGYQFRRVAVGAEGVVRVNHRGAGVPNQEPRGASFFARATVAPTLGAFARLDLWSPNTRTANRVDSRFWIAGLDWQPFKDVHVMPNVEAMEYVAKGTAVAPAHPDVQARITFYWRFSKPQS